ncbi:MAG: hypothetical protein Q9209_006489 [Squamulea sp. 1 TL-2023]
MLLQKSLPSLPPSALGPETTLQNALSPENDSPPSDGYSDTPTELPPVSHKRPSAPRSSSYNGTVTDQSRAPPKRPPNSRSNSSKSGHREKSAPAPEEERRGNGQAHLSHTMNQIDSSAVENLTLPSTKYNNRHSALSQKSDVSGNGEDFISMALDPNVVPGPSPMIISDQFNSPSAEKENIKPKAHPPRSGSQDYFTLKGASKSRKPSHDPQPNHVNSHPDSPRDSGHSSQPSSPHIAYQEIGRELSSDAVETVRKRKENGVGTSLAAVANDRPGGESPHAIRSTASSEDSRSGKFMLQDAPKSKKSGGSTRNSQSLTTSTPDPMGSNTSRSAPPTANSQAKEQQVAVPPVESPRSLIPELLKHDSPGAAQESRPTDNGITDSSTPHSSPVSTQIPSLPQRGDSLLRSKHPTSRKENLGANSTSKLLTNLIKDEREDKPLSAPPAIGSQYNNSPVAINGTRSISKSTDSPETASLMDVPHPPLRARERDRNAMAGNSSSDSFMGPRQSPFPTDGNQHKPRNESISTLKSESTNTGDHLGSPKKLPRYSAGQEFTMDEDLARILGSEEQQNHESFLRRVSNSVRHARSYSDRGTRLPKEKWPRSPLTASSGFALEASSPTPSSPETREELTFLKNELRRERQRSVEKDHRLVELETALEAKSSIKQMNTELREKRSTMIVLDTQKEIVVRELEVLTEHIAESKKSREPLDLNKMSNAVLREFAESLQSLKESFTPQIEDLTHKRNELMEEVSNLTQLKDRNFQEFEQVSTKNAQLMELNNTLVHQIQELYKANASPSLEVIRPPNGLGIYGHSQKDSSAVSFDQRDVRPSIADSNTTSTTLVHEQGAEPAAYVSSPQVVNLRKGQPKKFNWKKGGHNVAKVTKGLKGAFSSSDGPKPQREEQYTQGRPYDGMAQNPNLPTTEFSGNHPHDPSRQGFGFFSNQKGRPPMRTTPNGSVPVLTQTAGVPLFGSELQHRADYEASDVPSIVMRCIQEVEVRGMEIEGIYRKSGGNSQIQQIKEGFERTNDYDVSDPDLDINAVTSTLKQYLRKLPTPLITYDVYDKLLTSIPPMPPSHPGAPPQTNPNHSLDAEQRDHRVGLMRQAIGSLPAIHRTCLEVLIFHLARVVDHEKLNLMTSLNVAVVFAPTVMRPESLAREMSESQAKNQAVQFLIENCHGIFLGERAVEKGEW